MMRKSDLAIWEQNHEKWIPKRSGGHRLVVSPGKHNRLKQQNALSVLNEYSQLICRHAHGFITGRNVVTAALLHRGYEYTLCCDLVDFFDNCRPNRIRREFELLQAAAPATGGINGYRYRHLFANWTSVDADPRLSPEYLHKGRLAQGLLTSPAFCNIATAQMDRDIAHVLAELDPDAIYTRYADDLSISTNSRAVADEMKQWLQAIAAEHGHHKPADISLHLRIEMNRHGLRLANMPTPADYAPMPDTYIDARGRVAPRVV
jgi:hypothetical protein